MGPSTLLLLNFDQLQFVAEHDCFTYWLVHLAIIQWKAAHWCTDELALSTVEEIATDQSCQKATKTKVTTIMGVARGIHAPPIVDWVDF